MSQRNYCSCEAIVFLLLGVSVFSKSHNWDFFFAIVTVTSCFFVRFAGLEDNVCCMDYFSSVVLLLTYFANKQRVKKIAFVDQLIIGYGGLRGAICYGLVRSFLLVSRPTSKHCSRCKLLMTEFLRRTCSSPRPLWSSASLFSFR